MKIHQLERAVVLLMAQLKAWLLREIRSISKRHGGIIYIYVVWLKTLPQTGANLIYHLQRATTKQCCGRQQINRLRPWLVSLKYFGWKFGTGTGAGCVQTQRIGTPPPPPPPPLSWTYHQRKCKAEGKLAVLMNV